MSSTLRRGLVIVYGAMAAVGAVVFTVRALQERDVFFGALAVVNVLFWLGLLVTVLRVDDRRRRHHASPEA